MSSITTKDSAWKKPDVLKSIVKILQNNCTFIYVYHHLYKRVWLQYIFSHLNWCLFSNTKHDIMQYIQSKRRYMLRTLLPRIMCKQGTLYVGRHMLKPLLPSMVCKQGTISNNMPNSRYTINSRVYNVICTWWWVCTWILAWKQLMEHRSVVVDDVDTCMLVLACTENMEWIPNHVCSEYMQAMAKV